MDKILGHQHKLVRDGIDWMTGCKPKDGWVWNDLIGYSCKQIIRRYTYSPILWTLYYSRSSDPLFKMPIDGRNTTQLSHRMQRLAQTASSSLHMPKSPGCHNGACRFVARLDHGQFGVGNGGDLGWRESWWQWLVWDSTLSFAAWLVPSAVQTYINYTAAVHLRRPITRQAA